MNQLYTVSLVDLTSYRITVAAGSEGEAKSIAKSVLVDGARTVAPGLVRYQGEVEATAEPAVVPGVRDYRVSATYTVDFEMIVPATSCAEAETYARRLYDENCGPFDFDSGEPRVGHFNAVEVQS